MSITTTSWHLTHIIIVYEFVYLFRIITMASFRLVQIYSHFKISSTELPSLENPCDSHLSLTFLSIKECRCLSSQISPSMSVSLDARLCSWRFLLICRWHAPQWRPLFLTSFDLYIKPCAATDVLLSHKLNCSHFTGLWHFWHRRNVFSRGLLIAFAITCRRRVGVMCRVLMASCQCRDFGSYRHNNLFSWPPFCLSVEIQ